MIKNQLKRRVPPLKLRENNFSDLEKISKKRVNKKS